MWLLLASVVLSGLVSSDNNYVGAERCKSCHQSAYKVWSQSAHARAMSSLVAHEKSQLRCTACHNGTPDTKESKLTGVQCETCHGPGRYYSASYVMKDKELSRLVGLSEQSEAVCKRCHDAGAPQLTPFDYAAAWARIAHGKD